MPRIVALSVLIAGILILSLSGIVEASARSEYQRGLTLFKSLLANEKRAGLRSEWFAVLKPFEQSLAQQPKGDEAPKCMYFIGRIHEELGRRSFLKSDRDKALAMFDKMVAEFPRHEWSDDSLYRKGLIWLEQFNDRDQARAAFEAVIAAYPKGDMSAEARVRLNEIAARQKTDQKDAQSGQKSSPPSQNAEAKGEKSGKKGAQSKNSTILKGIRHWSAESYTRVVLDLNKDVDYDRKLVERASGGNMQLQINLQRTSVDADVMLVRAIRDGILSQIRVGDDAQGGALVTLDLIQMDNYRVFTLPDPYRVVIDVYGQEAGKKTASKTPEADHVQTALSELKAKQESEVTPVEPSKTVSPDKRDAGDKKSETKEKTVVQKAPPPTQKTQPQKDKTPAKSPEITVSAKQKKYAGSLVEQLGLKVRTIMIDPGHGGKDPGAVANGVEEKDINLRMAKIMGRMLQEQGFEVHYTRTTDKFIPLEERTAMANAKNADLFISVHCNSYKDASIKGLEVYYLNLATDAQAVRVAARENGVSAKKISDMQFILSDLMLNSKINESRQMAALVEKEALKAVRPKYSITSHGSKGAFFYVLTGARMPSILVELGYLTNGQEAANLNSDAYLTAMARGLVGGVVAYKEKIERYASQGGSS